MNHHPERDDPFDESQRTYQTDLAAWPEKRVGMPTRKTCPDNVSNPQQQDLTARRESSQSNRHDVRRKVLVIEDSRDSADSLRMLLELLGHEVRVAYSGLVGLKAANEWLPDVVISDIGLPGMDGYALASELRRAPATAGALLIGVSGYGRDEDRRRARAAGFDFYLVKPAAPEDLQRLLSLEL